MNSHPKIRPKTSEELREEFDRLELEDLIGIQLVIGELIRLRTDPKVIYANLYKDKL